MKSIQNQPVVPVAHAQAAMVSVASGPTFEGFQKWLTESHGYASFMLCTTTGAEFARHAETLDHLGTALTLAHQFVKLSRG